MLFLKRVLETSENKAKSVESSSCLIRFNVTYFEVYFFYQPNMEAINLHQSYVWVDPS